MSIVYEQSEKIEDESPNLLRYFQNKQEDSIIEVMCPDVRVKAKKRWIEKRKVNPTYGNNSHKFTFIGRKDFRLTVFMILNLTLKYQRLQVTHMQQEVGLSWCQIKYYSKFLDEKGFVDIHKEKKIAKNAGNPNIVFFTITEKGLKYIQIYNGLKNLFNINDGLALFTYISKNKKKKGLA